MLSLRFPKRLTYNSHINTNKPKHEKETKIQGKQTNVHERTFANVQAQMNANLSKQVRECTFQDTQG